MNIKSKLITLLLFIGLIPTLVVGLVSYATIGHELNSNTDNQIESTTVKQQQKIDALLQARQEEVSQLSNQYDLQVALAQYAVDGNPTAQAAINQAGQTDKSAKNFAESPTTAAISVLIKADPADGLDKLYSYTLLSVNQKQTATMMVVFRIDDITAAVQDYTGLGATGETIIGQREGNGHVISQFPLRFNTEAALRTNLDSLELFDHTGGSSYTGVSDYRGHRVIIAGGTVGFANWVVGTKIDANEALAPIARLQNALIAIALFSSVIIVLVAIYFSRFFTGPILRIARISKLIGQGDFSAHIDLHRSDELGALADSVNTMGMSLREFVAHIESQRKRLEVILNSTEEGILAVDKQGVITTANRAAAHLMGQSAEKIVGLKLNESFRLIRDGRAFIVIYDMTTEYTDLEYTDPEGVLHYLTIKVARVNADEDATSTQAIITIHDETKSRELEDMKIDFVSMAAHELRTPLAAIRGYLELITYKEQAILTPEIQKYLRQAVKSTDELGSLINNLLDVTRIERGTLTLNMGKVDIAANVAQAVRDARFMAADKNITLTYMGVNEGCFVEADLVALHEVINNLISNAVKYTDVGGRVVVTLDERPTTYEVTVKDNGMGIPKAAIPNLFTKFYRVHGGLNSGSTGTGLGLFIAKSIIEHHNGTINVESQEGRGSTFRFSLPILTEERSAQLVNSALDATNTRRKRGWTTKNTAR